MPMLIGGVVAGAIGFFIGLAQGPEVDDTALQNAVARINALEETVDNLPTPQAPEVPQIVDLSPLEATIATQAETIAALSARVERLATTPASDGTVPAAAFEDALAEMRAAAEMQQNEIAALLSEAEEARAAARTAAQASIARTAVTQITAALETGAPFADALATLADTGQVEVPEALSASSADGVQPLAQLQSSITDAARDALFTARSAQDTGGLASFFERQLGARSVTPREGDDPDAILSRIEAAVRAGDLGTAIDEANALPDVAQDALALWLSQATIRHDAVAAAQALADTLAAR
ncbi:MAG: hypothetical protein AAF601_05495 [Pseudomonadota bacterium]